MNAFGKSIRALLWLAGVAALGAAGWVGVNKYRGTETAGELPVAQAREGEFLAVIRCRGELTRRAIGANLRARGAEFTHRLDGGQRRSGGKRRSGDSL